MGLEKIKQRRAIKVRTPKNGTHASFIVSFLLSLLLCSGSFVLGAARTWVFLPLCLLLSLIMGIEIWSFFSKSDKTFWKLDWANVTALAFFTYVIGRYVFSPVEYAARLELLYIACCLVVFFVARYGLQRRAYGIGVLFALVFCSFFVVLFAFWLKLNPQFHPYTQKLHLHYAPRIVGTYGCPNHLGALLYMGVAASFILALVGRFSWWVRIGLLYMMLVMMLGVGLTMSRGSWIGLWVVLLSVGIYCVVIGKIHFKWFLLFILGVLFGGAAFFYLSPSSMDRLSRAWVIVENGTWESYVRVQLFFDALKIFKDYPWFGSGMGTFGFLHPRYHGEGYQTLALYAHNDYIHLLADYGIIGFLLVLSFIGVVTRALMKGIHELHDWREKVFRGVAIATWFALLVHSFVDFNMHIFANALWVFALVGFGLRSSSKDFVYMRNQNNWGFSLSVLHRKLLSLGFIAFTIIFLGATLYTARAYFFFLKADQALEKNHIKKALKLSQKAVSADLNFYKGWIFLGDIYRVEASKQENILDRAPFINSALKCYQQALRSNPFDDATYVRMGMTYDLRPSFTEAYLSYMRAIKHQPYNGYFYTRLGNHHWRRGFVNEALKDYEKASKSPFGGSGATKLIQTIQPFLNGKKHTEVRVVLQGDETAAPVWEGKTEDGEKFLEQEPVLLLQITEEEKAEEKAREHNTIP